MAAAAAGMVLCVAVLWGGAGSGGRSAHVTLQQAAVGAVGPGSMLTLQTASGPMRLTVDSQMNQGPPPCAGAPLTVPVAWLCTRLLGTPCSFPRPGLLCLC